MSQIVSVLYLIVFLYMVVLVLRLLFDLLQVFAREWRPTGVVLVAAEAVYTMTDPPLKALRRVIPSPTIGSVRFDLSFIVLFLVVNVLLDLLA